MRYLFSTICIALLVCGSVLAQEKPKTGADPRDFITRYEPSYEHKELENGSELDLFVLRTDLALRRNLSLRVDLPLVSFDPSSTQQRAGFDSESGFGDMITQLLYKPYSDERVAALFGLRIDWDTATGGSNG